MKKNIWKILAAAGSFVVLANSRFPMKSYAENDSLESVFMVSGPEECRRLLMELVSSSELGTRKEYIVTGEDYEPETLIIAQMFPETVNISNTKMREYDEDGHHYITCRIGFERSREADEKKDSEIVEGDTENRRWSVGDIRTQRIGKKVYRFQCVDDDYGADSQYEGYALFLCETVIPSDIDSTDSERKIVTFGETNNYKNSSVRKWLKENTDTTDMGIVNTGVNFAFVGATVPGTFHEFTESGFLRHPLPVQQTADQIFLLSLEEALRYQDLLWEAEGKENPFSRGYWLRTPAFETNEDGKFQYGTMEYVVDLERGCIRTAKAEDGSIGIRPAFCLPQG